MKIPANIKPGNPLMIDELTDILNKLDMGNSSSAGLKLFNLILKLRTQEINLYQLDIGDPS